MHLTPFPVHAPVSACSPKRQPAASALPPPHPNTPLTVTPPVGTSKSMPRSRAATAATAAGCSLRRMSRLPQCKSRCSNWQDSSPTATASVVCALVRGEDKCELWVVRAYSCTEDAGGAPCC